MEKLEGMDELLSLLLNRLGEWRGIAARVCWRWRVILEREKRLWISTLAYTPSLLSWSLREIGKALDSRKLRFDSNGSLTLRELLLLSLARHMSSEWLLEELQELWSKEGTFPFRGIPVCKELAYRGELRALAWVRGFHDAEITTRGSLARAPWNEEVCFSAERAGKLFILDWLLRRSCPYDPKWCMKLAIQYQEKSLFLRYMSRSDLWPHDLWLLGVKTRDPWWLLTLKKYNAPFRPDDAYAVFEELLGWPDSLPTLKFLEREMNLFSALGGSVYQSVIDKQRKDVFLWMYFELKHPGLTRREKLLIEWTAG